MDGNIGLSAPLGHTISPIPDNKISELLMLLNSEFFVNKDDLNGLTLIQNNDVSSFIENDFSNLDDHVNKPRRIISFYRFK